VSGLTTIKSTDGPDPAQGPGRRCQRQHRCGV